MSQAIEARVEGLQEARRALERVMRAEQAAVPGALEAVGEAWVTEIVKRAPLLTGRLRRSYTYKVDRRGKWVEVSSNIEYAPYQEFGTRYMPGTPHVRPATEAIIPKVPDLIATGVGRAAMRAGSGFGGGPTLGSTLTSLRNLGG